MLFDIDVDVVFHYSDNLNLYVCYKKCGGANFIFTLNSHFILLRLILINCNIRGIDTLNLQCSTLLIQFLPTFWIIHYYI